MSGRPLAAIRADRRSDNARAIDHCGRGPSCRFASISARRAASKSCTHRRASARVTTIRTILTGRSESLASHRDGRGAAPARRDDREYREYLREEQRRQRGCIARRMQPGFHHGLLTRGANCPLTVSRTAYTRPTPIWTPPMIIRRPSNRQAMTRAAVPVETWMLLIGVLAWDIWVLRRPFREFDYTDFATFYDTGRAWLAGTDLYKSGRLYGLGAGGTFNLNPPIATIFFAPFALLSEQTALVVWLTLNLALLGMSVRVIVRDLELDSSLPSTLRLVVWIGVLMPTFQMLVSANLVWILMLPATLAWRAARRGRDGRAGAWLGIVLACKPIFLFFLPYWLVRRQWRSAAAAASVGVGSLLAGWLIFGADAYRSWIAAGR